MLHPHPHCQPGCRLCCRNSLAFCDGSSHQTICQVFQMKWGGQWPTDWCGAEPGEWGGNVHPPGRFSEPVATVKCAKLHMNTVIDVCRHIKPSKPSLARWGAKVAADLDFF